MTITEVSRFSQLSESAKTIVDKASAEYGVTVADLAQEISHKINEMSVSEAVKAANWYFDANAFAKYLAETYETSIEITAAIISAVSPRMPWLRNKFVAQSILMRMGNYAHLSADEAAKEMKLGLNANVSMAIRIARGADIANTLTGIKRRSFFNNIVAPASTDSVTIDTWMQLAYSNVTGKPKSEGLNFVRANEKALRGTGAGYLLLSEAVRMVAEDMNMLPHQIQALYWVAASGGMDGGRSDIS